VTVCREKADEIWMRWYLGKVDDCPQIPATLQMALSVMV